MIVIKIIIYFIFFLLNFLNLILGAPILTTNISPRWGHTATLVGTRIYFIGGRTLGNVLATEFLSLDVSKSFTSLQPEWFSFDTVGVPKALGHTAVKGGPNNDQIIIFGGSVDDPVTALTSSLYVYDTVNDEFTNLKLPNGPNRRYDHSAVTSPSGKMLIYGGYVDQWTGSPKALMTSELWELNTINLNTWNGFPSISNSPGLRRSHTASIIENKMEFSSVVANEKIIIYGGTDVSRSELYGDVAILDTNTWTWSKQETTNSPPNRSGHTATLVGANMIVAFGSTGSSTIDSSIYILNIINWSWDTQYVPMELPSDDSFTTMKNITNPNINRKNNANNADTTRIYLIVIIVLAVVCGILFIIIIWYVIYKLIDDYKIRAGIHLVGHPYESNPIQSAEPQQPTRPRPAFLCLGRSNKRDKHYSTQSAQGLVNNYSIPTSPSTGPSTPHTMTMNNNRYSNNSGSGTFNRHSFASGVGGAGGIGNIGPFTRFS
ncbi:galactose oxidase, partial [Rhizophagus irregularis]